MQFKLLALSFLAAVAMADDDNLSDTINEFPTCSLPCVGKASTDKGCSTSDIGCICNRQIDIAASMSDCVKDYCGIINNFNAGKQLADLCDRWDDHPSSTEVAAATSALGHQVASASATVKPKKGAAGSVEAGMFMAGSAAVAAAALLV
ncbi:hypothetical protein F5Y05DRAFT_121261 [Hypoxylon sp. FL0543]|nr:hypothetical protein F5Y05DRAFT_121261 [Hypoxylon sp. FL0543]